MLWGERGRRIAIGQDQHHCCLRLVAVTFLTHNLLKIKSLLIMILFRVHGFSIICISFFSKVMYFRI